MPPFFHIHPAFHSGSIKIKVIRRVDVKGDTRLSTLLSEPNRLTLFFFYFNPTAIKQFSFNYNSWNIWAGFQFRRVLSRRQDGTCLKRFDGRKFAKTRRLVYLFTHHLSVWRITLDKTLHIFIKGFLQVNYSPRRSVLFAKILLRRSGTESKTLYSRVRVEIWNQSWGLAKRNYPVEPHVCPFLVPTGNSHSTGWKLLI